MRVTWDDIQWLRANQPGLAAGLDSPVVVGTLDVSAYYDRATRRILSGQHSAIGDQDTFVRDQFPISVVLSVNDQNGWPKVYDLAKRYQSIANRYRISVADLHFYADGHACLGLTYPWDPPFSLGDFVVSLVQPFFYRLTYVDLYGLSAARADLWPEYSHGKTGLKEHERAVRLGPLLLE